MVVGDDRYWPVRWFACGMKSVTSFSASGLMRSAGIVLFGNATPVNGSLTVIAPKLPARCASESTLIVVVLPRRLRKPTKQPNPNNGFLTTCPPSPPPTWFQLRKPLAAGVPPPHKVDPRRPPLRLSSL